MPVLAFGRRRKNTPVVVANASRGHAVASLQCFTLDGLTKGK